MRATEQTEKVKKSSFPIACRFFLSHARYYAIVKPLKYPINMTKRKVAIMIIICWLAPALLSFVPIFAGKLNLYSYCKVCSNVSHI